MAAAAADTAELNEVMDDLVVIWAKMHDTHGQLFTPQAANLIGDA